MTNRFMRICSLLLVAILLTNMLPMSSFAQEYRESLTADSEAVKPETVTSETKITEEVLTGRSEFSKEFKLSNGLHMAVVYPEAVHYEADGQWEEIDNTLKTAGLGKNAAYTNTAGVWDVSLPQALSGSSAVTVAKDGYTLSFVMSGELRTPSGGDLAVAAIGKDTAETFSVQSAKSVSAQVQKIDLTAAKAEAEYPETVPDKLRSRLQYADVYENTDIVYDLTSNRLKESIVIESYSAALRGYQYTLNTGSMIPVLDSSGRIDLYDETQKEIVMTMPAPYLLDDAGEFCGDVTVELKGSSGSYTLTYLLPQTWMADETRQWPVILDPIVEANVDATNISDISVYSDSIPVNSDVKYPYLFGVLDWGHNTSFGIMRSFMKYNTLPALTSSDIVVSATLRLYKPNDSDFATTVQIHKVNEAWESQGMVWAEQPEHNSTIEDFGTVQMTGYYSYDITDIARGWYEGENTGLIIRAPDEVENTTPADSYRRQFTSSDNDIYEIEEKPTLFIQFRNNNGLESYWDYTASSAGRAGTGYVNNYTGNLVWVHSDIGFGGNRMPVSISHVYNANDAADNEFGMGHGWRTNFNQRVYQWPENENYYVWEDSDGTDHYFENQSSGVYKDEDGLELTLTTTGSGDKTYCITDKYGNCSYFDGSGRLTRQENNQQTKSSITIAYSSGNMISTITDGAGRVYEFTYNGNDLLTRISYRGDGSREFSYVVFGYSGSQLTSITDKDNKSVSYGYTTGNHLSSAQDIDGYKLSYTYYVPQYGYQPYRVKKVSEYSGSTLGGELNMEYAHNQTTFTDHNKNVQIMQFNNFGNTVSIQDGEGRAQYAQYATETGGENAKGNQLRLSSKLQNTVGNLIQDASFENGTVWNGASSTVVSSPVYLGTKALKITGSNSYASKFSVSVAAGESYTFSGYVKSTAGSRGWLALGDVSSEIITGDTGWQRLQATYTNNTGSAKTVEARVYVSGTAYLDCVQLEKAPTASRYNLIENGDFRYGEAGWTRGASFTTTERCIGTAAAAPVLDGTVYSITGSPSLAKHLWQRVQVSGSAGDTFVLAGWAKGDSAPLTDSNRAFGLYLCFNNTDGSTTTQVFHFNPDTDSNVSWQYGAWAAVADKAYSSINIDIRYDHNVNTAYFDGIQLYKEEFGSSYTYDKDGNVISVVDLQKQTTQYKYTNNNLTEQILPTGAALTYTYDNYHNVKTATSGENLTYEFTYDNYGNNTAVSIVSGGSRITSSAAYSSDGNRMVSSTDALGKVTQYSYNENTNVLEWVKYPEDTEATRTNYTYDEMYRLSTAAATTDTGSALTAAYTYENDLLTSIQTGSTTYTFAYGAFSQRSSIKIGSRTLATYSYTNDRNNFLSRLDYGNGDRVQYEYDKQGRVTKQTYEDGDTVSYAYDNNGALATVTDSATGIKTTYYYDFTDRLMKYVESGDGLSHSVGYAYDDINNLTSLVETINGVTRTTSYTYDNDNRVSSMTDGNTTRIYHYDDYGRVASRETKQGSTTITETLTYTTPSATSTTGQVATYSIVSGGVNITYRYTYDNNGNILSVTDGTNTTGYVYDSANQLIRENNQAGGYTHTWAYDNAGNIQSRTEYAYTTGTLGTPIRTVSYSYDDTWGDLLTGYDGNAITSDTIGNMLSDGKRTYTWEHGRQLAAMTCNISSIEITGHPADFIGAIGDTASFTVTANGDGLTYRWQYSTDGGATWQNTTVTTANLSIAVTQENVGRLYRCVIKDSCGTQRSTNAGQIRLSWERDIVILEQPQDYAGAVGNTAVFAVTAEGEDLTYKWVYSEDSGTTWKDIPTYFTGYDTPTLSFEIRNYRIGYCYRCIITSADGNSVTTETATLRQGAQSTVKITNHPTDKKAALGETVSFTVNASGSGLTYQWQVSTDGGTSWQNANAATTSISVTLNEGNVGNLYRCLVTDAGGFSEASGSGEILLDGVPKLAIVEHPQDCGGTVGETVYFTVVAKGKNLTYQWQYSGAHTSGWEDLTFTGYDTPCMPMNIESHRYGYEYRCVVTDSEGNSVASESATLEKAINLPQITAHPADYAGAIGSTANFTVTASGNNLSYQWQCSTDGGKTWQNANSKTASISVTVSAENIGDLYRCRIIGSGGYARTSRAGEIRLTGTSPLTILRHPSDKIWYRESLVTFGVIVRGTGVAYRWQLSEDGGTTWQDYTAGIGYDTAALQVNIYSYRNGYQYRCIVTDVFGNSRTSDAATLCNAAGSGNPIEITSHPSDFGGNIGSNATFAVIASGNALTYQWEYSEDGGATWLNLPESFGGYNTPAVSVEIRDYRVGYLYRCKVTDTNGNSRASRAARLGLSAMTPVVLVEQPHDVVGKLNEWVTFSVSARGVDLDYQWEYSENGGQTWLELSDDISGCRTPAISLDIRDYRIGYRYRCIVTDAFGNSVTSEVATLNPKGATWEFAYNADGIRTQRTNGTTTYSYIYNGSQLSQMTVGSHTLRFSYDANGAPLTVTYGGTVYHYVTNLQGDITAILNSAGSPVVSYSYDAWGNLLSTTGAMADTLGRHNPLRYRGYVYDQETGLYYVSSRYYDPEIGRWINADSLLNQESVLGNNMFAYCLNNPVNMADTTGELPFFLVTAAIGAVAGAIIGGVVAAKNGGNVWAGIGIGAAAGGLAGAGFGAAAGVMLAGSATASTAAVASGAGMLATAVSTGGAGAGLALVADNISRAASNVGTVLYSGGEQARQAATTFANSTGGTTIDPTVIGQVADAATKVPGADFTTVWSQASATFCHQASGVVNAFVSNSAYRGVDSIFWSVEMPTLLNNPRVTEIIIHIFE